MRDIEELKNETRITTGKMVLLTIATSGLFPLLWLWRHQPAIDRVTGTKTASNAYLLWLAACVGFYLSLSSNPLIGLVPALALTVLYVIWAFRAKTALQDYAARAHGLDLRMNAFYALIFTCYYINYCINDLPEAQRRQQALAGHLRGPSPVLSPAEDSVPSKISES